MKSILGKQNLNHIYFSKHIYYGEIITKGISSAWKSDGEGRQPEVSNSRNPLSPLELDELRQKVVSSEASATG